MVQIRGSPGLSPRSSLVCQGLNVSVRNTFVHVDSENESGQDGEERQPTVLLRSRTAPARRGADGSEDVVEGAGAAQEPAEPPRAVECGGVQRDLRDAAVGAFPEGTAARKCREGLLQVLPRSTKLTISVRNTFIEVSEGDDAEDGDSDSTGCHRISHACSLPVMKSRDFSPWFAKVDRGSPMSSSAGADEESEDASPLAPYDQGITIDLVGDIRGLEVGQAEEAISLSAYLGAVESRRGSASGTPPTPDVQRGASVSPASSTARVPASTAWPEEKLGRSPAGRAPAPPKPRAAQQPGAQVQKQAPGPRAGAARPPGAENTTPGRTTVMLRNLPNNYTRAMVLHLVDSQGFKGKYDFVYFPIDFKTQAALGYAFLNLVTPGDAERLRQRLDGFCGWALPSSKVCSVGWSHPHQGLEAHIARYRSSPLMHEAVPDAWRPIVLLNGERVAFPPSTRKVKPPRQGTHRVLI